MSRATIRFISKQLKELHDSPPEGINVSCILTSSLLCAKYYCSSCLACFVQFQDSPSQVLLSEENITEITAEVEGPGTNVVLLLVYRVSLSSHET